MKLEDIKPKYIVLNQTYDDFAHDTEEINYEEEDYLSQVLDITSVLYTNSLEGIWGFLGFVWDVFNDYGHFNTITMPFSVIPQIPDGQRIKQFKENMFTAITSRDIEVLDSNFVNLESVDGIASYNNKRFILHLHNTKVNRFYITNVNPTKENNLKYKGSSIEIYCENSKTISYMKGTNNQANTNDYLSYIIFNNNVKSLDITPNSITGKDGIRAVIRYEEDDDFDITKVIKEPYINGNDSSFFTFQAKNNKFILPFKEAIAYNKYFYCVPYNDYKTSDNLFKFETNNLDNIFEFTVKDTIISPNRTNITFPAIQSIVKKVNFDIDVTKLKANIDSLYGAQAYINRLAVLPELNNVDWFLNETFETLIDINLAFDKNTKIWNYLDIHIEKDIVKTLDLKHSKTTIAQVTILDNNNELVDEEAGYAIFPFKFINSENATCAFTGTQHQNVTIENNKYIKSNTTGITYKYPIVVDTFEAAYGVLANETEPVISAKSIYMTYNPGVRFNYNKDYIPTYVAPFKCLVENNNKRHEFKLNINSSYQSTLFDNNYIKFFNYLIASGKDTLDPIAIIDNPDNYTFTTNDRLHIGCSGRKTSGGDFSVYKNNKMKYAAENYYVNTEDKYHEESGEIYFNLDVQQWNLLYNYNIRFYTIQTNIHNFVNAIADKELPSGVTRNISILHENYIQLSEEEKEKIINLGYILNDVIS